MKNFVIFSVTLMALLVTSQLSARTGFSLGVFSSYAIDGGNIEDIIENKKKSADLNSSPDYPPVIIPGGGVTARFDFSRNLFIRTGFEYNELASGGNFTQSQAAFENEYEIKYRTFGAPLLFGISSSSDKGSTNVYGAVGMVMAQVEISQERRQNFDTFTSEEKKKIYGLAGVFGIEKRIVRDTYVVIEYAFYRCETIDDVTEKHYNFGFFMGETKYQEQFEFPVHQIRLGLRYAF